MRNYADYYLSHLTYDVEFESIKANANADYCSRAPLPTTINYIHKITIREGKEIMEFGEFDQFILCQIKPIPVRAEPVAKET